MEFLNVPYGEFIKRKGKKKIIHFGAASVWNYYMNIFSDIPTEVLDHTAFIVDNDAAKQGQTFEIAGRRFPVKSVDSLMECSDFIILVTVSLAYQKAICEQLSGLGLAAGIECYSLPLMLYSFREADNACVEEYFREHVAAANRPVIHTFWFSGEEKPELYKRCMESRRRYCPDFEIMEWNMENYDVTKNGYMKEAIAHRKWAFASDYARLDVIYRYGGIYMDMDVELLAPLTPLLSAESFFCRQEDGCLELGSGFGAKAGDPLIGEMLETYRDRKLFLKDGRMDMTAQPEWLSGVFKRHGIGIGHDSAVSGNRLILSNDYIACASKGSPVQEARLGIHWHNGAWLAEKDRRMMKEAEAAREELTEKYFKRVPERQERP